LSVWAFVVVSSFLSFDPKTIEAENPLKLRTASLNSEFTGSFLIKIM